MSQPFKKPHYNETYWLCKHTLNNINIYETPAHEPTVVLSAHFFNSFKLLPPRYTSRDTANPLGWSLLFIHLLGKNVQPYLIHSLHHLCTSQRPFTTLFLSIALYQDFLQLFSPQQPARSLFFHSLHTCHPHNCTRLVLSVMYD